MGIGSRRSFLKKWCRAYQRKKSFGVPLTFFRIFNGGPHKVRDQENIMFDNGFVALFTAIIGVAIGVLGTWAYIVWRDPKTTLKVTFIEVPSDEWRQGEHVSFTVECDADRYLSVPPSFSQHADMRHGSSHTYTFSRPMGCASLGEISDILDAWIRRQASVGFLPTPKEGVTIKITNAVLHYHFK